jgi:succinate-semialdehyde dehydrogenase/glutarate-semialdehyde dehydrogenase
MNDLLRTGHYIGGEWHRGGATYVVRDPASGEVVADVAHGGTCEAALAIEAAHRALPGWRGALARDRAACLRRWADLMLLHRAELAALLSREQGKPLAEAAGEVAYAASFLEWFGEEAKRVYGDVIPSHRADARIVVTRQPVGVVAAITPWNFPLAMVTRKVGPALAAGCTLVLKPSEETPLSALALAVLAERAGVPAGVFNVVSGDAAAIGATLLSSPLVRKLTFTGSTRTGKLLARQATGTLKKVSLELGGNAPFVVFADADLDAAVQGAIASKFRNTGQTCVCVNRFLVQEDIFESFTERLAQAVRELRVGPAHAGDTDQGPLINAAALEKVERHVHDALAGGARLLCGGRRHELGGTFYEPTVLADVVPSMLIAQEETFGPVAACFRFRDEEQALHLANDTEYGLAAYVYTRDIGRVWRMAEGLEAGMVGINEGIISTEVAPFGGIKESGTGREGSRYGIDDYLEIKYLLMGGLAT